METPNLPFFLVSLTVCLAAVAAHNTPRAFLDAHNCVRAEVGVPPLVWNATLAAFAQAYSEARAVDCAMVHSDSPYGENLAYDSYSLTAKEAVDMWAEEKSTYNVALNQCTCPDDEYCCFHYTQLVWKTTTCVGCGTVKCENGWNYVTCSYYPPGNVLGDRPF